MIRPTLRLPWVLAGMAAGLLACAPLAAAVANDGGPRIVDCRVGLRGHYKVGYWTPVWVDITGVSTPGMHIEVTVHDPDGVEATVVAKLADPTAEAESAGGHVTALAYVKFGRIGSPLDVALVAEGRAIDRRSLEPGSTAGDGRILPALPTTAELLVSLGPIDLSSGLADRQPDGKEAARQTVRLEQVAELPTDWFGYEGVDLVVVSTGNLELSQALAADQRRLAALKRWVELGGRLVVLCGRHAPQLLGQSQPLAGLIPGTFVDTVRLTETSPLEHFSRSEEPIARGNVVVARLRDVTGQIDVYAGMRSTDLPLVVRAPRGLGELAFVGLDLDAPPVAEWRGLGAFLRALLQPYTMSAELTTPQTLVTLGYNDLSGALRQRLGRSFNFVTMFTFPFVAMLAILYLVLLGPADYFLVHKLARRPWLAWVTFPLLVVAVSGGACWLVEANRGGVAANQLELIDVDLTTGQARGTYWGTLYSPRSRRYDMTVAVQMPGGHPATDVSPLLSALGLPGTGLGGMHSDSIELGMIADGYQIAPHLDALERVPLVTSSTKSLLARWTAPVGPLVEAQLAEVSDGLLVGTLTNRTGQMLTNVRLLYGRWAYQLGDVPNEQQISVDQRDDAILVRTLITRAARGPASRLRDGNDREPLVADRASLDQLLNVMMFYEVAGGDDFAQLANRYQSYCDFSRLLTLGRAVLVADGKVDGSRLVDRASGKPLRSSKDRTRVVYRFVLPVNNEG